MEFSVLISVYEKESASFLKSSLNSILLQSLMPNEIVLVKDGLLGEELNRIIDDYVTQYPIVKTLQLPINRGLGIALNKGLEICSYDIIARMDTDDIAKNNRFEKQISVFQNDPCIDVVGTWVDEFEEETSKVVSTRKLPEMHQEIKKFSQYRNPINHPVVMFKKAAVINAGSYQHCPLFEDYYLWVRMLMNGAKFYNIQEALLFFRLSPDMFKRRGGWRYVLCEYHFQKKIRDIGYISPFVFIKNIVLRFGVRLIPNVIRAYIYKKILRK